LRQVVSNLVANAIEHGSEAEPVGVAARGDDSEVFLTFRNGGNPISSSALLTLFDPFVRSAQADATRRASGIGLGLYIARGIAIAHGGSITVTSSESAGTVFTVCLPRRQRSDPGR
jgi:signal transduction histidine kinase